jgi:hypothetical protein
VQLPSSQVRKGKDDPNTGCQNAEAGLPSPLAALATTTDEASDIDLKYDRNRLGSGAS